MCGVEILLMSDFLAQSLRILGFRQCGWLRDQERKSERALVARLSSEKMIPP